MRHTDLLRAVRPLPIRTHPATQTPSRRTLASGATLAILCLLLALPARSQTCINTGVTSLPTSGSFYSNFASTSTLLSTYGIPLTPQSGSQLQGDANSIYMSAYYSITNAINLMSSSGYCPFELVIVGNFPETRYFSISDYDMHYSPAQHLLDADIDPVGCAVGSCTQFANPFIQNTSFTANQTYMVPISLGSIPGPTTADGGTVKMGCVIDPYEGDNLLDATQRHSSMDWNTVVTSSAEAVPAPPSTAHVVDTPGHGVPGTQSTDGQNRAGQIVIRNYLLPTTSGCTPTGSPSNCPNPSLPANPYLLIRDVSTGCAYNLSESAVYNVLVDNNTAADNNSNFTGIVAVGTDPSTPPTTDYTHWLDQGQEQNHDNFTLVTQQGCFANGDPTQLSPPVVGPPYFYNRAAWVRSPEWVVAPGPDDAYIAAQIPAANLSSMASAGRAIRMRLQLPSYPNIPCTASGCKLTGSEQLRYWSLSFEQVPVEGDAGQLALNLDGVGPDTSSGPVTLVSLADTAFAQSGTGQYVDLIVGTGADLATDLPSGFLTGAVGAVEGAVPVTVNGALGAFSVLQTTGGYTVLDLSQFSGFNTTNPLVLVVRNTLPNTSYFSCSGQTVSYSTALYTNITVDDSVTGSSLMGPYVPLVDYPTLSTLPGTADTSSSTLPSASYCGLSNIPGPPFLTPASALSLPSDIVQWPTYWPADSPSPLSLYCSGTVVQPTSPTISFAASLLSSEDYTACSPPGASCNYVYALSNQSDAFSSPTPPPLTVAIKGTGFGYLPQILPVAVQTSSFLEIHDDMAAGGSWDTNGPASCQMYIANWTDTSISLVANIPISATDDASANVLSPLSDMSPLTFFTNTSQNTWGCPVANGDTLTFTVTNPQHTGAGPVSGPVCVGTPSIGACP